ncbi:hypothetical protein FJZ41_03520 [Candidatus Shapirobacteria bacterium]|nr:hypothetical protein [Candidatus Shapirobacteria bacterium]
MKDIFGTVKAPFIDEDPKGLVDLFNNLLRLLVVVGGIYALLNFIIAGYSFMSAAGDPKKIEFAWAKIWQSMVGLMIIAAAFVLAALIGKLLFNDTMILFNVTIYGPGT